MNTKKAVNKIIAEWLSVALVLFELYMAVPWGVLIPASIAMQVHLLLVFTIGYLTLPMWKDLKGPLNIVLNALFFVLTTASIIHIASLFQDLSIRSSIPHTIDVIMGTILVIAVLDLVRRKIGWAFVIVCVVFILYSLFGQYVPIRSLSHGGYTWKRIIGHLTLGQHGIFGQPLYVIVSFVFHFVLFGELLSETKSLKVFLDLSCYALRKVKGGPAYVANIASTLLGSVSGSATANTVTTGAFTIPLMKKVGFKPHQAAAIEVCSSLGGQWLPPVMGASAFIIVGMLGIPYVELMAVAVIPALLYEISIFFQIFAIIGKSDSVGYMDESDYKGILEIPTKEWIKNIIRTGVPIGVLLFFIISAYAAATAAMYSIIVLIILNLVIIPEGETVKIKFDQIFSAFKKAGKSILPITIACAAAGIIVSSSTMSGLAIKFTNMILSVSDGSWLIAVALVAVASLFLGMGVPTTGSYIIVAVVASGALITMGIPPILAHLIAFWYATDSSVTPPVCITSYAGAALAGADPWKTAMFGWKTAKGLYIIPLLAIYTPLTPANWATAPGYEIALAIITAIAGLFAFAIALEGSVKKFRPVRRILWGISCFCLFMPQLAFDIVGLALFAVLFYLGYIKHGNLKDMYRRTPATA
ncbi:MAG: hypothetical protein CVV52_09215 [Spirochaetae bacterium HGW-Spirochaetae-8]|nr:MAG: hypothetical protein CVV52_09215 [Spirochaetae bacterium HGW-Spirochaetae-8]